jgi:hypothetical protein
MPIDLRLDMLIENRQSRPPSFTNFFFHFHFGWACWCQLDSEERYHILAQTFAGNFEGTRNSRSVRVGWQR